MALQEEQWFCPLSCGSWLCEVNLEIDLIMSKLITVLFFRSCLKEIGIVPNVVAKFVEMQSAIKNLHNFMGI